MKKNLIEFFPTEPTMLTIKEVKIISDALGLVGDIKLLGGGAFGWAYDIGGKVLKITTDEEEALLANRLRRKPITKHIINYYDVRNIYEKNKTFWQKLFSTRILEKIYSIVMDKVIPLDRTLGGAYMDIKKIGFFDDTISDDILLKHFSKSKYKNFINKLVSQRSEILDEFDKYDILPIDAHYGNVGFKSDGTFVIFDLGIASGKGTKINLKPIGV